MNLSEIYVKFLEKEEKDRDQWRLFATDVGRCTRKTGYRLILSNKDSQSEQAVVNKVIMFDLADHIERILASALDEDGKLIDYQADVVDWKDRENWGGRIDIAAEYCGGARIIEVKTLHPNAFRYTLNYPAHRQQASVYHIYTKEKYELTENPIIAYFDRGGSNTPVEQFFTVDEDHTLALMDELDDVRDELQRNDHPENLPPQAGRVLKVRNSGKRLTWEPSPDCAYCEYQGICKPHMGVETWANRLDPKEPWIPTPKADPKVMEKFANECIALNLEEW